MPRHGALKSALTTGMCTMSRSQWGLRQSVDAGQLALEEQGMCLRCRSWSLACQILSTSRRLDLSSGGMTT